MASAAQVTANQANARFSTGPRTEDGKARSARNALRHGLTARELIVREDERADFETLRDEILAELAPEGAVETITFHELLHAAWNLHRYRRLEAESFVGAADPLHDDRSDAFLERLARYQARAQRAYYRALKELRILQTNRALRAFKLAEEDEPEVPAIADINELTKQTHSEVQSKAIEEAIKMLDYQAGVLNLEMINKRSQPVPSPAQKAQKENLGNPALRL